MSDYKDNKITDEEILEMFRIDKHRAFRLLYDTYYYPLCLYSIQITGSNEASEDIIQNIFLTIWEKDSYKNISTTIKGWLFGAAHHLSLTYIKKRHPYIQLEETDSLVVEDLHQYDEEELEKKRDKLLSDLKKLPPQEYAVLTKIMLEKKKYKDVATEMNISVNTVKTHLNRALKNLRQLSLIEILIMFNI